MPRFNSRSLLLLAQLIICIVFVNIFIQYTRWILKPPVLTDVTRELSSSDDLVMARKLQKADSKEQSQQSEDDNNILYKSFEPGEIRKVLLVTQQRSGSTFLGEMFNQNPDTFYWFEPLDGVYNAMYGSVQGWNVPSDLTSLPDGTERLVPPHEKEIAAEMVGHILNCELEKIPTNVLMHNLVMVFRAYQHKLDIFIRCVKPVTFGKVGACRKFIQTTCPLRFGTNWDRMKFCYKNLFGDRNENFDNEGFYKERADEPQDQLEINIDKYKECMNTKRQEILPCLGRLKQVCLKSKVRVVKTVRMTLDSALKVRQYAPNLRIILNIRHPIGIAVSRQRTFKGNSYMSIYASKNATKEAQLVCRNIQRDLQLFYSDPNLKGNSMLTVYEKTSKHPVETINEIYNFMDLPVPWEVNYWHHDATKNSANISLAWTHKITLGEYMSMKDVCSELFIKYADKFGWRIN